MGITDRLADECGVSKAGVVYTSGKIHLQNMVVAASATDYTTVGCADDPLLASTTTYSIIGRVPKGGRVSAVNIRSENVGVAGATIDIMKVASGTAVASGVALVTQIAGTALTASTNYTMALSAVSGAITVDAGNIIFAKIVTGVAETLCPLFVDVEITL